MMDWLFRWLNPNYTKKVKLSGLTRGTVEGLIFKDLDPKYLEILDSTYLTCTKTEFKRFLKFNKVDRTVWSQENEDCDNFGRLLQADALRWIPRLPIGIITFLRKDGSRHYANIVILRYKEKFQLYFIEAETDELFRHYPGLRKTDIIMI